MTEPQQHNNSNDNQDSQTPVSLRRRREALGLSRLGLAVRARCSVNTVTLIEEGVTRKGITRGKINQILTELEQA